MVQFNGGSDTNPKWRHCEKQTWAFNEVKAEGGLNCHISAMSAQERVWPRLFLVWCEITVSAWMQARLKYSHVHICWLSLRCLLVVPLIFGLIFHRCDYIFNSLLVSVNVWSLTSTQDLVKWARLIFTHSQRLFGDKYLPSYMTLFYWWLAW